MKMLKFRIFILLIIKVYSIDISSFHVNYFKQNTKLYYANAMNNVKGNIYFEFWGENDNTRYYIGKNYLTEESILFNNNQEYFSIQSGSISSFHESIIVNEDENTADNNINILSMNWNTFDYINFQNSEFTYKPTKNIAFENKKDKVQSYRNSLIKIKYNDNIYYFSFMIMYKLSAHYLSFTLFELTSNNINDLSISDYSSSELKDQLNSTNCLQTESGYILCLLVSLSFEPKDLNIRIYEVKKSSGKTVFSKIKDVGLSGTTYVNSFLKLFLIKDEIFVYIFFDGDDGNKLKLFIKKLNNNKNGIENVIPNLNYINPTYNSKYEFDTNSFSSDAIKVSDTRFISVFKIKNSYNRLLCIFDFNEDYTSIIVKYYLLNLEDINIQISVNIRCFYFKEYFGIIFYDSYTQYPGYIFFNYINIINENKIDFRTIRINLSESSFLTTFSFTDNINIINNLYNGDIKIKITSLPSSYETGIIFKSLNSNSIISNNDILNIVDSLIIDTSCSLLGDYFIEFFPFSQENDIEKEIYGDYQENNLEEQYIYYTKDNFKLIFSIDSCSSEQYIYNKNQQETYCLSSCNSYQKGKLYQDENEKICYNECSKGNNNKIFLYEDKCISQCPIGYSPDENNICILIKENQKSSINTNENNTVKISFSTYIETIDKSSIIDNSLKLSNKVESSVIEINQKESAYTNKNIIGNMSNEISSKESYVIEDNLKGSILEEKNTTASTSNENGSIDSHSIEDNLKISFSQENSFNLKENYNIVSSIIENTSKINTLSETSFAENSSKENTLIDSIYNFNQSSIIIQAQEQTGRFDIKSNAIQNNQSINSNSELSENIYTSVLYTDKTINSINDREQKKCDINKTLLISDYKTKNNLLEYKDLEECSTTYYCYSSNTNIDTLININPKLTYIDINNRKNELINNNILTENSDLLIVSEKHFDSNIYTYELYDINGNKINMSICNNKKIETVSSIDNIETYEKALALYNQGYDIFNLSSSFYNDICISVNINSSDITLSIRQKDIKPDDNLLCSNGCTYNGVNLTTKRISCLCDINNNKKSTSYELEEVKDNFFSYILDMINYKIIKCYMLLKYLHNYYYNYGFYIGAGISFLIAFLFIIYLSLGKKAIKLKYLRNEPKKEEIQLGLSNDNNNDILSSKRNLILEKKRVSIVIVDTDRKNKKYKSHKKNKSKNDKINPPAKTRNLSYKKTIDNSTKTKLKKDKNNNIIINTEKNSKLLNKQLKNEEITINTKNRLTETKNKNKEKNNIDYNELTYKKGFIK